MGEIWCTYGKFNKCIGVENLVPNPKWDKNTPETYQYTEVENKVVTIPNSPPLPEGIRRNGRMDPHILIHGTRWRLLQSNETICFISSSQSLFL